MATINSVTGPMDTANLGFTLMHEHVTVSAPGIPQTYPQLLGDNFMDRIITGLTKAKKGGIDTIVDMTPLDLGRDVTLLAEAARKVGINIIACTGMYFEPTFLLTGISADKLADLFIDEIREGIGGTKIKAAILKGRNDIAGVTPGEEVILRALARAHLQTDVPIALHQYSPGRVGMRQIAIMKEEGVSLRRVKLDHCNDTTDVEYITWILEQGCFVGMDRYPGHGVSALARTKTLKALIDAGFEDRILPSHDHFIAYPLGGRLPSVEDREKQNPHGYLYVKDVVFPQLLDMGVSQPALDKLCVDNPRRFFEGA
ncbi:MAG: phosphotriesterase-related protein [Chloroflexi bacterium]|nr:phosphotriesterase-related protein [Chloroflexota bacterium]